MELRRSNVGIKIRDPNTETTSRYSLFFGAFCLLCLLGQFLFLVAELLQVLQR